MSTKPDLPARKAPTKGSPKVQFVEIGAENEGQRIDNFLMRKLKGVPKSLVYRIVRKGEVRINKGRIKPEYKLKIGDLVRIPPVRQAEKRAPGKASDAVLKCIERRIIFEDKRIMVINKPSGLAVHGGSGLSYGLIEALRELRPNEKELELVHRLDRDTSGCIIIAKKRSALRRLHEQLREGTMEKHYFALVKGKWKGTSKWVDAPLIKNVIRSGERLVFVDTERNKGGKDARSQFIPYCVAEEASLMTVKLDTGRTHQIRVHAKHIGYPLAGDEKYGDDEFNRQLKSKGLKRLFLHAFSLKFKLAEDEPPLRVEAPLDESLLNVLNRLKITL